MQDSLDTPTSSRRWLKTPRAALPVPDTSVDEPVSEQVMGTPDSTILFEEDEGQTPPAARTAAAPGFGFAPPGGFKVGNPTKMLGPCGPSSSSTIRPVLPMSMHAVSSGAPEGILRRELEAAKTSAEFERSVLEAQAQEMERILRHQLACETAAAVAQATFGALCGP